MTTHGDDFDIPNCFDPVYAILRPTSVRSFVTVVCLAFLLRCSLQCLSFLDPEDGVLRITKGITHLLSLPLNITKLNKAMVNRHTSEYSMIVFISSLTEILTCNRHPGYNNYGAPPQSHSPQPGYGGQGGYNVGVFRVTLYLNYTLTRPVFTL